MNSRYIAYALAALLTAAAGAAYAGAGNRTGTNGAGELLIPIGARDIAMGGTGVATSTGVEALFWNPAGAARMQQGVGLYFSHMTYLADIGVDYGAVSAAFEGFGVLSLNLKSLSIGEIPVTTTQYPDGTGQTFRPQFFTLGLSYGRQLSDRISVGVTATLINERMAEVSASGVGFTAGVQYANLGGAKGLMFGVAVKNIGPQMKFDGSGLLNQATVAGQNRPPQLYEVQAASFELPSTIEFGLAYQARLNEANGVLLSSSFQSHNFSDDEYRVGLEYAFQDLFFIRGGWNFSQKESADQQYLFGPSFGTGIHTALGSVDVSFDYAYRKVDLFDANHVFAVKLGF